MLIAAVVGLAACGSGAPDDSEALEGETLDTPWTKTFRVVERDGYRIVDIEASLRMARSGEIQQGLLADIVKMLHPELRDGEFRYLAPETWKASYEDHQ